MKNIQTIAVSFILIESLGSAHILSQVREDAYAEIRDPKCINAIHQVQSDIENRLGGAVGAVSYYDPSQKVTDSPNEKSKARILSPDPRKQMKITFDFLTQYSRGRQASQKESGKNSSIINSPNLTQGYALKIIGACPDIGSVRFWMWEWGVSWSVDSNGTVTRDRCVDGETWQRRPLIWGEMLCV